MEIAVHNVTIAPDDPDLAMIVTDVAQLTDRPWRPLHLQALLQGAQAADATGAADRRSVGDLVRELADEVPAASEWRGPTAQSPRALDFRSIEMGRAADVMQRFHYLHSPRLDGSAFGLVDRSTGTLVVLGVLSPLDVGTIAEMLGRRQRRPQHTLVISRVFAFAGAPRNSLSYLLARMATAARATGIEDVVTYINPNLGFTGASYRASGWSLLGEEPGTRYHYVDRRYVTARQLAVRFGRRSDKGYSELLGDRFHATVAPLRPLLIYWRPLTRDRRAAAHWRPGQPDEALAAHPTSAEPDGCQDLVDHWR